MMHLAGSSIYSLQASEGPPKYGVSAWMANTHVQHPRADDGANFGHTTLHTTTTTTTCTQQQLSVHRSTLGPLLGPLVRDTYLG